MDLLRWLFDAKLEFAGGGFLLWREVLGNLFGLASALGGMRRKVWAWPVGVIGNVLLFTVFMGSVFGSPVYANLLGQAGRQLMFIAVSAFGWYRWRQARQTGRAGSARTGSASFGSTRAGSTSAGSASAGSTSAGSASAGSAGAGSAGAGSAGAAVEPRWASGKVRVGLVAGMIGGTALLTPLFGALGSYAPVWADAWIFMGSLLATYGMAKGWVEFWLIWVAVDVVGVPLLFSAGYFASAFMYIFYGAFTLTGFFVWWRVRNRNAAAALETAAPDQAVAL